MGGLGHTKKQEQQQSPESSGPISTPEGEFADSNAYRAAMVNKALGLTTQTPLLDAASAQVSSPPTSAVPGARPIAAPGLSSGGFDPSCVGVNLDKSVGTAGDFTALKVGAKVGPYCQDGKSGYGGVRANGTLGNYDNGALNAQGPNFDVGVSHDRDSTGVSFQGGFGGVAITTPMDEDDVRWSRVGINHGGPGGFRLNHSDRNGNGEKEYGFGFDFGPITADYATETPLRDLAISALMGPMNAFNMPFLGALTKKVNLSEAIETERLRSLEAQQRFRQALISRLNERSKAPEPEPEPQYEEMSEEAEKWWAEYLAEGAVCEEEERSCWE